MYSLGFLYVFLLRNISKSTALSQPRMRPPLSWRYGEGGVSQLKCLEFITWDVNGQRDNVQPKKNGCFQVGENGGILYKSVESEKDFASIQCQYDGSWKSTLSLHCLWMLWKGCCIRLESKAFFPAKMAAQTFF